MENLPILQDVVPYRGRCPKTSDDASELAILSEFGGLFDEFGVKGVVERIIQGCIKIFSKDQGGK